MIERNEKQNLNFKSFFVQYLQLGRVVKTPLTSLHAANFYKILAADRQAKIPFRLAELKPVPIQYWK